jgi:membrane protein DedA with SNARE-associated domain
LDRAAGWLSKYGIWALFIGKLIPGMSLYTVVCFGMFNPNSKTAKVMFLLSNLVFFSVLAAVGKLLGNNLPGALIWLSKMNRTMAGLVIVVIIIGILFVILRKRLPQK